MAKGRKFGGAMPMGNMNNMLKQVQKMQKDMAKMQEDVGKKEFETTAGGGAVKVKINGKKEILSIQIDDDLIEDAKEDKEMLEDLILTCVNQAIKMADDAVNSGVSALTGGMNIPGLF